jgi:DNA anti-recombination protein RmuC
MSEISAGSGAPPNLADDKLKVHISKLVDDKAQHLSNLVDEKVTNLSKVADEKTKELSKHADGKIADLAKQADDKVKERVDAQIKERVRSLKTVFGVVSGALGILATRRPAIACKRVRYCLLGAPLKMISKRST